MKACLYTSVVSVVVAIFYRATLCYRGICYGPVSVCVCVCEGVSVRVSVCS